jgi:hypothetical protein
MDSYYGFTVGKPLCWVLIIAALLAEARSDFASQKLDVPRMYCPDAVVYSGMFQVPVDWHSCT